MPGVTDKLNSQNNAPGVTIWAQEMLKIEEQWATFRAQQQQDAEHAADKLYLKQRKHQLELEQMKKDAAEEIADLEFEYEKEQLRKALELDKTRAKRKFDIDKKYQKQLERAGSDPQKKKNAEALKGARDRKEGYTQKGENLAGAMDNWLEDFKGALAEGGFDNIKDTFMAGADMFAGAFDNLGDQLKTELVDNIDVYAGKAASKLLQAGTEAINSSMTLLTGTQSKIAARLQSSGESFTKLNMTMQMQLAASPFVKYTDMLGKVEELVDKGVAYNVDQRAFLASISDKIASTFDAFDANLLKIIRIQQEDSTKQRLGMEASLTKFLNKNYQDTSYLSGAHDSVTEALTASIVQLGTARGAEFEYQVQKWFGSLSSLGMDDNTLTGLASAINALSTGDVEAMASSEQMNLIVMAANRAGMSYADLLTQGVNADNVNDLLSNIVAYWSEIANTSNQVVKNQYSKLFGLSMTDMTAIKNVTQSDMDKIYKEKLSYDGMRLELTGQMLQIPLRMAASEMLDNVMDNVITGIGMNIASNPAAAATWVLNSLVKDATGGINIPTIGAFAMGTGLELDLETDINSLIQLGMVGISTIGQVGKIIGGLGGLGGLNLAFWGADKTTRHGAGLSAPVSGVTASTSSTTFIGNSSGSDIYSKTLNQAKEDSVTDEVKAQQQDAQDEQKKFNEKVMDEIAPDVHSILTLLQGLVGSGGALRVTVDNYGLTNGFGI